MWGIYNGVVVVPWDSAYDVKLQKTWHSCCYLSICSCGRQARQARQVRHAMTLLPCQSNVLAACLLESVVH